MANRYWVGGTGNWDATTTNWSATSGGAGGASVPTLADDVFFDTLSNLTAYTVTLLTTPVCRSVNIAGPVTGNVTIAGTAVWNIYGSLTFAATGVTNSYTGFATFVATTTGWTVTTNGVAFNVITIFSGVGGGWTLGSAFTAYGGIQVYAGTLTSNNYSITTLNNLNLNIGGAALKTVNLGSSAVSCQFFEAASSTSLTLNSGTSTISVTSAYTTFTGGGQTYYNVSFTATSSPNLTISGVNTFNNLTFASSTVGSSVSYANFQANQTINGTLTMSGASYTQRLFVLSSPSNTSITLSVTAVSALSYIDFGGITVSSPSAPWSGISIGNLQNNVNITTSTPKTVYWNYPNAVGSWGNANGSVVWATSSGGATSLANFPLAQDICIFDNVGLGTTGTVSYDRNWALGKVDFSALTNTATFNMGAYPGFYQDVIFSPSLTLQQTAGTVAVFFSYGTQTLTSAGLSFPTGVNIGRAATSSLILSDNASALTWYLGYGALNLNNNTLTASSNFNSNNVNTRSIAFGTGAINISGNNTELLTVQGSGMTCTGSKNVNLTYSGSVGTRTWFNNVNSPDVSRAFNINITAGTDIVTMPIIGASNVNNLNFTGFIGTYTPYLINLYGNLTLGSGMTVTNNANALSFIGTGTQTITTNGVSFNQPTTIANTGTVQLQSVFTSNNTVTLTSGILDLNNNNLTSRIFASNNANTRSIAFGTGQIYATGNNAFVINLDVMTGFTYTGSGVINCTYSGGTGTRGASLGNGGVATEFNALSVNVTAGTDQVQAYGLGIRNLNFTGFAGSFIDPGIRTLYGDLTLSSGMTVTATLLTTFAATSGTQNITSNGKTITFPITKTGAGTLRLVDALTLGSGLTFTLTEGTFDLNGRILTTPSFFTGGASIKSIAFGGGTIVLNGGGGGIIWDASGSNFSTSGSGKLSCTAATNKVFNGAGFSYPTISQDGAGILYINGNNTFRTLANTVAPATISMQASSTTSIAGFDLVGSAGNLITLNSFVSGTQVTFNNTTGGRIGGDYLSYQDTNATPASTISAGANSVSVSNNTGWLTTPVVFGATAESYTITETESSQTAFVGLSADSLTLTDSDVSQIAFAPTTAESLTLADAQSTQVSFVITNAEALTLANTQATQVSFVSTTAESVTFADAQGGIRGQFGSVSDSITLANTQASFAAFAPQVAELLVLAELISIQSNLVGYTAETIVFTDAQTPSGWIKINNSQNPNWTSINNNQ